MPNIRFVRRLVPKPVRERLLSIASGAMARAGFVQKIDVGPVDLQGLGLDPDEGARRAAGLPFVIDVPVRHVRNVMPVYFPCKINAGNPFVETIRQYLEIGVIHYADSHLKCYHDRFQPRTIAETLGLGSEAALHPLLEQPPLLTFAPWVPPPLKDYRAHLQARQMDLDIENRTAGAVVSHVQGYQAMGPIGPDKGELEITRLVRVTESIAASGYLFHSGLDGMRVLTLRSGEQYRFLCTTGNHRLAAIAALGHETVPVWPARCVDRADVADWPGVRAGVFTSAQALEVFDRMFWGNPPPQALAWWRDSGADRSRSLECAAPDATLRKG